jgi:hypothetical protein
MTTEISEGIARFLGIDTSGKLSQETIFEHYRTYQDAIKQLEEKLKALKPMLYQIVEEEGGKFEQDGYLAQIVESKPTQVLKTKAEVLIAVPKKYHYLILKDMFKAPYLKVAVAPKDNIAEVTINKKLQDLD